MQILTKELKMFGISLTMLIYVGIIVISLFIGTMIEKGLTAKKKDQQD